MYDIIIGRPEKERERLGKKGTVFLGKHYVKMGQVTSLSNDVFLDVIKSHVVFVVGKRGGGKCLHGDSNITLHDGSQTKIKELENDSRDIFTLNSNLKMQQSSKSGFHKRQVRKLLKMHFRSGKEIKLTHEHPLLTVKGWMPAEKLHIGSRIATPRRIEAFGDSFLSEAKIKLIAYLTTEGHLSNNLILFSNEDEKIIDDFKSTIKSFDQNLKVKIHSKDGCFRVVENKKRIVTKDTIRDKKGKFLKPKFDGKSSLRKWSDNIGIYGELAHQKMLPEVIFNLPKNKISLLMNRLFSCDGSIYKEGKLFWKISYSSSSKELINQIQHLLLRFGVIARLRPKKTKNLPSYELEIKGEHVHTFLNEIGFFGKKEERAKKAIKEVPRIIRNPNVDTIPKEIWDIYKPDSWAEIGRKLNYSIPKSLRESVRYSPSRQKLLQIAKADECEMIEKLATSDIFWDEVVSIETIEGVFDVYDITVPEHHNFVANDIIVHNSYTMGVIAEGMADLPPEINKNLAVVMLDTMGIYWTMKYPNEKDKKLLKEWGLEEKGLDVSIYTPKGYFQKYKDGGIPTDFPFAVKTSELAPSDWCTTFEISINSKEGVLIERTIQNLLEKQKEFDIDDVIKEIQQDTKSEKNVKDAIENRFSSAKGWGLFDKQGTPFQELVKGGQVTVLDVSCYATIPGASNIRALVIGLVADKLFIERMISRKVEEQKSIHAKTHYLEEEAQEEIKEPLVWLVIDEAHEFLPNEGVTTASRPLITILREGRQPGISLILASQQPGKIHTDVITQSDTVIAHRLTAKMDIEALGKLMQSYMRSGLDKQFNNLPKETGSAVVFDDTNERLYAMKVRPRFTWHGGEAPSALIEKKKVFDF